MVAKTAGKIRYPELMHGEGKIFFDADTTNYMGIIDYPDKLFSLKAKTWKNSFFGVLTDSKNKTTLLTGEKVGSNKPLRDYTSIISSAFSMVEKYFWDVKLLQSSDWQNYKNEVNNLKMKIADDYELGMTTMWLGKKLTQIPHEIRKVNKKESDLQQRKNTGFTMIREKKALILLNNFQAGKNDLNQIFKELSDKHCETLILEASGNRNLPLSTALLLANHLSPRPSNWGIYLTRKWSAKNEKIPRLENYETELINPMAQSISDSKGFNQNGYYLKTEPAQPLFRGNVYVLVNKGTSNVAEALAIYLKNNKSAILVGQKTSGSPNLTELFEIDKLYSITIPTAQFYDIYGKSYQGIGAEPDLFVEKDALGYVLKL
jgi:hypothetical protein